jgi:hypothetical protein
MINTGSGYIAKPLISFSDSCAKIESSGITVTEGRIENIVISGTCVKVPTITLEDPSIPATATLTKTGIDTFSVNYTNTNK